MNSYLQIEGLTKRFGDLCLYKQASLELSEGQRVAIVAQNGAGKSTLLRIIAENEPYEEGQITMRRGLRISYLPQIPQYATNSTVLDAFMSVENEVKQLHHEEDWVYETKAKQILTQLKVGGFDQKIATLSGGQLKRLALANALISEPDLLILDEPTNHLDLSMVEWLEDYLNRSRLTLLMVTHDRYFLDRVCSDIVEIADQQFYRYKGNYSYYLNKKEERMQQQTAEMSRLRNLYRRELEWIRSTPQARGTKAKSRIDDFQVLQDRVSGPQTSKQLSLQVQSSYIGSKIFEAQYICKAFGDKVLLKDFYYQFSRYEKMGIVGDNGTGKSTFVKMLLGMIKPDSGSFDIGETVRFGYFSQEGMVVNDQKRVLDVVRDIAEVIDLGGGKRMTASQFLQHFLFPPEKQQQWVYKLSGGERRRLYLCTVLMENPNFLVLDEPTNDLDIVTLNVLEDYLANFKGCVIVVSHDRYFMDKVVDHLLVFKGQGEIKDFPGNYTQYRQWQQQADKQPQAAKTKTAPQRHTAQQRERRLSYAEKCELERLDTEINQLETEKKQLEEAFSSGKLSDTELMIKSQRMSELITELDTKSMRWLELSDI